MSGPIYIPKRPPHFGTRLANPYTRYGDKPYVQCPRCNQLYSALGFNRHFQSCRGK